MKLGLARGGPTRQDRAFRLHRDRLAAPKLRVKFPAIEQLRFELSFEGEAASTPVPQSHVAHPPARAYFSFPCPHADCDGLFDLSTAVHSAVKDPSHQANGTMKCAGMRAGDSSANRSCHLILHFTVTAKPIRSP